MIITKPLYINRFEPALLNVRAPMGIEAKIDVTYYTSYGDQPYNHDLAAQLHLTSRSGNQTTYYPMPATDVLNGKARATIPAGDLTDPNGYRLRITGTHQGEPILLAMGTLFALAGAGPQAVPEDTIDTINLVFNRGEDADMTIKLWQDTGRTIPLDIVGQGLAISARITMAQGGPLIVPFVATVIPPNEVNLTLTVEEVNALPDDCWWTMQAASSNGTTVLAAGSVTVAGVP